MLEIISKGLVRSIFSLSPGQSKVQQDAGQGRRPEDHALAACCQLNSDDLQHIRKRNLSHCWCMLVPIPVGDQ